MRGIGRGRPELLWRVVGAVLTDEGETLATRKPR